MPSDVFWTGLFTFGGGVVGTTAGYATARLQGGFQKEKLHLEERRDEFQFSQAGDERVSQLREQRRKVYLRYLEDLDGIINLATHSSVDQGTLSSRWTAFMQADNELELAGTKAVKKSSYPLHALIADAMDRFSVIVEDDSLDWPADATAYMRSIEDELREARQGTVSLMREDLHSKSE